jgi:hypothetical protein
MKINKQTKKPQNQKIRMEKQTLAFLIWGGFIDVKDYEMCCKLLWSHIPFLFRDC